MPVTLAPNLNAGFDGSEPAISWFPASYAASLEGLAGRRLPQDRLERPVVLRPLGLASRLCTSVRIASCVAVVWAAVVIRRVRDLSRTERDCQLLIGAIRAILYRKFH